VPRRRRRPRAVDGIRVDLPEGAQVGLQCDLVEHVGLPPAPSASSASIATSPGTSSTARRRNTTAGVTPSIRASTSIRTVLVRPAHPATRPAPKPAPKRRYRTPDPPPRQVQPHRPLRRDRKPVGLNSARPICADCRSSGALWRRMSPMPSSSKCPTLRPDRSLERETRHPKSPRSGYARRRRVEHWSGRLEPEARRDKYPTCGARW